ncbi:MAG TPA: type IV pilin protein [Solimonas sp.]|nr:type IV pilin protein [Solimonas sp.]
MHKGSRHLGFTLVELVTVMAAVAVLVAAATPSFRAHALRSNRTVGKLALVDLASRQENFRADRRAYARTLTALGLVGDTVFVSRSGELLAADTPAAAYRVTLASASDNSFEVVAAPVNMQAADVRCGELSLKSDGGRGASGTDGVACWQK